MGVFKVFTKLNEFLQATLSGFNQLERIEVGVNNVEKILINPELYSLSHIGADIDAWVKNDRVVISFDNDCHFVFTPINCNIKNSLRFVNNQWV